MYCTARRLWKYWENLYLTMNIYKYHCVSALSKSIWWRMAARGKEILRRSIRTTEKERPVDHLLTDQPGLFAKYISDRKGFGVYTSKHFVQGDILLHYWGNIIPDKEANRLEEIQLKKDGARKNLYPRSFLYYFSHNRRKLWWRAEEDKMKSCLRHPEMEPRGNINDWWTSSVVIPSGKTACLGTDCPTTEEAFWSTVLAMAEHNI